VKKLFTLYAFFAIITVNAQTSDTLIMRAMSDELTRNMKELKYDGFEAPFYISYSINDVKQYAIAASMGALLQSNENRVRSKNIRVLVGDYEFNDESLDNNNFTAPEPNEIQLPLDNDYYGIRRSLWVTTDYIYKSAARQYKKNLETLEEKKKTISEIPHRSFASKPVVTIIKRLPPVDVDRSKLENYVRALSAEFLKYPKIEHTSAYLTFTDGYTYFINSEGSKSVTPVRQTMLHLSAIRKSEEGETLHEEVAHYGFTPADLPSLESMKLQIQRLCELLAGEPIQRFNDEYNGPVLITGKSVAELFSRTLFASKDALIASDVLPDPRGYRSSETASSIDSKIGKLIISPSFSVRSLPALTSFDKTPLLGAFEVDDEGVVPDAEVLLIEQGILRNLLNDRSLIKKTETANGHSSGPGVIEVSFSDGGNLQTARERLIAEAKKQGLDYALMIKDGDGDRPYAVRISVSDGKEELLRSPALQIVTLKDLKDVIAGTAKLNAYNVQSGDEQIVSFIVPEALLLKDIEVKTPEVNFFKEEEYITNPLHK
jgi:predicted Zn-dependent protease